MANEKNCFSHFLELFEFTVTFCLEENITHRKSFIHDQNLRININGNSKSQSYKHTAWICFHRLIYKITDIGKIQNRLQLGINFLPGKANHTSIQIHILNPGILHIKAGSQLQKSRYPAIYRHISTSRRKHPCNNLKDRGLTGTIGSDDSNCFPFIYLKRNMIQGKMFFIFFLFWQSQGFLEPIHGIIIKLIHLTHITYWNCNILCHFKPLFISLQTRTCTVSLYIREHLQNGASGVWI